MFATVLRLRLDGHPITPMAVPMPSQRKRGMPSHQAQLTQQAFTTTTTYITYTTTTTTTTTTTDAAQLVVLAEHQLARRGAPRRGMHASRRKRRPAATMAARAAAYHTRNGTATISSRSFMSASGRHTVSSRTLCYRLTTAAQQRQHRTSKGSRKRCNA
eukprot:COSAG03_NODE_557_length_6952_cov_2.339559_7_plen_159_part_00